jgi:N-methylhydantoinase A
MTTRYRLGIDIGGTFTDATLLDTGTGVVTVDKVPTTPSDPSLGFIEAAASILQKTEVAPADVEFVVHATTVATNSIIEGKLAPTAFVTTGGFGDMLELARQMRPSLYDLRFEKPAPLIPRYLCFEVPERLDARGQVLIELDEAAVRELGAGLRDEGVTSVAVCLLHSYVNPAHEYRVAEILSELCPGVSISVSADVAPEFREFYRASTTVINAAISPVVSHYIARIEEELVAAGIDCELLIMQSNGGVYPSGAARSRPVFMVESGPAAGVIAATYYGAALGYPNVISSRRARHASRRTTRSAERPRRAPAARAAPAIRSGRP